MFPGELTPWGAGRGIGPYGCLLLFVGSHLAHCILVPPDLLALQGQHILLSALGMEDKCSQGNKQTQA